MSGLVKFAKKAFKKVRDTVKKVLKSDIFKVVVVAAAVVFTGGAALGALGASGGGIMATLQAGFQGGMAALKAVGSAIMTNVVQPVINFGKAAFSGAKSMLTGGAQGGAGGWEGFYSGASGLPADAVASGAIVNKSTDDPSLNSMTTNPSYTVSNPYFTIDSCVLPEAYSELLRRRLMQDEFLPLNYKEYYTFINSGITGSSYTNRFAYRS